ncbi:MAG: NADH-quinone oxidoreductase subunit H [Candidatus Omnitrophica bacterium]|nr:NADH-quinone oxidoreductase subunit H [Candidatus Omnitrophota bacterium]MDD5574260.1 NADH-quinone oxidoreductase subunit H [Candidatus Omnitrophota bacterium]
MNALFQIIIFPGFLFLFVFGLAAEFLDRKFYARLQNRVGPPWFQPLADFIKLVGKEEVITETADVAVFRVAPLFALATTVTAIFYIPLWHEKALLSFEGDIIVVLYLLTIPSLTYFLGGWYSRSIFSMIGAVRSLTQLFAYEVPLFLSVLAAALLANTWSLSKMTHFYAVHPWLWVCNAIGFLVALIALLGKLEKVPFDIPEAETEMVAGSFTEYGGRLLAFFRMALDIEMVVGASLLAAVFLPWGLGLTFLPGFLLYLLKTVLIIGFISLSRAVFARLRLDQMLGFCWKYLAPLAFLQVLLNLTLKGFLVR